MAQKARALGLSLLGFMVLIAISACPLALTEHILINFGPGGPVVTGTFTFTAAPPVGDSDVIVYKWNFGDGTMAEGKVVTHSYPGGGRYTVALIVVTTGGNGTSQMIFTKTIEVLSVIAYIDEDSFGNDAIFVINSDGSGLTQVTNSATLGVVDIDNLDINSFGQIVYTCEIPSPPAGVEDDQLCAINSDGSDDRVLTSEPFEVFTGRLNDVGQVVYVCEDSVGLGQICVINLDGTGRNQFTGGNNDNFDPEINNLGQIAYICQNGANPPQICVSNFSGFGKAKLTSNPDGFFDAEINDAGEIFFECLDSTPDPEICKINYDGTGFTQLTDSDCCTDFYNPEPNQFGNLAFQCDFFGPPPPPTAGSSIFQSCVVDSNGFGLTVVPDTGDPTYEILEIHYSGHLIAAVCGNTTTFLVEICVYDDEGFFFAPVVNTLSDLEDVDLR